MQRKLLMKGKVKEAYDLGDRLEFRFTDNISVFDKVIPSQIPFKGETLSREGGQGYPPEWAEAEKRNKKILDSVKAVTHNNLLDILKKLDMAGQDLNALSLDTVAMFRTDAVAAGFSL